MARRRTLALLLVSATACCLLLACAETTRYRVLSFFFDGVPAPGEAERKAAEEAAQAATAEEARRTPKFQTGRVARSDARRMHPPYREMRCGECHAMTTRAVMLTPQDGLCRKCHDIPEVTGYVHGPVAVSDCLFCHHHHGTQYPKLLLDEPTAVCLRCHDRDDLIEGPHHDGNESCIKCHHGHGGSNRYFLKNENP